MTHNVPEFVEQGAEIENELNQLQLELVKEQRARQDLIRPLLMESLGIDPETGELTGRGQQRMELQDVLLERQLQAATGDLPVPEALERDINEQQEQLRAQLREQFGAGFETASPAMERLEEFRERANLTREQARRGERVLGADLLAGRESASGRRLSEIMSVAGPGTTPSLFSPSGSFAGAAGDFQSAAADRARARDSANTTALSTLGGAVGTFLGGGSPVGGALGTFVGGALGDIF